MNYYRPPTAAATIHSTFRNCLRHALAELGRLQLRFKMKTVSPRLLMFTFAPAAIILMAILFGKLLVHESFRTLTSDVTTIAGLHPITGFLSTLGIFLWCATASICFFAAMTLINTRPSETFWFLLSSAVLSAYLLLDDAFLIHENLAKRYLGLSERAVFSFLVIAVIFYAVSFRRIILRTDCGLLFLALIFLATGVAIDEFSFVESWLLLHSGDWEYFIEDGLKWLGITCWCSYYAHTSYRLLIKSFGSTDH